MSGVRREIRRRAFVASVVACAFAACAPRDASVKHEVKTAERATSPLIGSWLRDGDIPPPSPNVPQFVELVFRADGTALVTYEAAAGALAGIVHPAPKVRKENDTYVTTGDATLHLREGTSQRVFTYDLRDGKLYLTSGGGDAAIFAKTDG